MEQALEARMSAIEIETSQTIAEIAKALAKAQQKIESAKKNKSNPHFRSSYADLAEVIAAAEPLAEHGIAVSQIPFTTETGAGCVTLFMHESGEWIRGRLELHMTKKDAQGAGSCITYARRFSLQGMANIAAEDDDGNAASRPAPVKAAEPRNGAKPVVDTKGIEQVRAMFTEAKSPSDISAATEAAGRLGLSKTDPVRLELGALFEEATRRVDTFFKAGAA